MEQQLRELERERDGLDSNYTDLASRNLEADLASDLQTANTPFSSYRVIDLAVVPTNPTSPWRLLFLLGGAIAGIATVAGATFLREMVVEPVHSASETSFHPLPNSRQLLPHPSWKPHSSFSSPP